MYTHATKSNPLRSRAFTSVWLIAWTVVAGYCLWRAAPRLPTRNSPPPVPVTLTAEVEEEAKSHGLETRRIEELRVGDRVVARDELALDVLRPCQS